MAATLIINPDGTSVLIGGKVGSEDYTKCFIVSGAYSDEYQGSSDVRITVRANRRLPITIGARIFPKEPDGSGGYILLSPPTIERVAHNHFIYEFTFLGTIHLLETKLLFNQDLKGDGWNLSFPLVGTATDFLTLICTNMNRVLPVADQITETWYVDKVDDDETSLLIDFDNDNCLTALKKVSEAFRLPYRTSVSESAVITLDLTNECRVHDHVFQIGDGLSKFKILGDADRPFATALHVLGGMQNIPYDYRGGSKRLRTAGGGEPGEMEVISDDGTTSGAWTTAKDNTVSGVTVNFNSVAAVFHGTKAIKIYPLSGVAITGQGIKMTGGSYDATGSTLTFHIYLEPDEDDDLSTARIVVMIGKASSLKWIQIQDGMYGYNKSVIGQWQTINIPVTNFGLSDPIVEVVKIYCLGYWPTDTKLHLDYTYLEGENLETLSFIYNENDIQDHGRIEAVTINEDIYPKSDFAITTVVSAHKFIDTSLFDLNEVDGEGNPKWSIDQVQPKINFLSGNLSGYSFAMKAFTTATKEIELVPYKEDSGNDLPGDLGGAYGIAEGDKYVITEIRMPDEYMEDAEDDLLEWGMGEYADFAAHNEIAEIEIGPVWVKKVTGLQYTLLGDESVTHYDIDPLVDLFIAGDLININIEGLYSRQLRVLSVVHELFSQNLVWKVKLGNNTIVNISGKLVNQINGAQNKINSSLQNLKLVKYFMG